MQFTIISTFRVRSGGSSCEWVLMSAKGYTEEEETCHQVDQLIHVS